MTALVYEASQQKCCCGFESLRLYKNNIVQLGSSIGNQSNVLQCYRLWVQLLYGVHLRIVLSYNGYYVRFWLSRCRFDSCRDYKYGFSSVGGSVGLQNQRSEVRTLQPVQMELWCRWLFARWTENPEALVRLKVAPQILQLW